MNISQNIFQIRKLKRALRRQLTPSQQRQHQHAVKQQLIRSGLLRRFKRFAIYLANDGELGTQQIIDLLLSMNKQVYLPVLYPLKHNRLWFLPYKKNTVLKINRFNIAEPTHFNQRIPVTSLSVIFMPLVAFDEHGSRVGMGGGFYDRTLSAVKMQRQRNLPLLVGLAHELQLHASIERKEWDIPLDQIITEKKARVFLKSS